MRRRITALGIGLALGGLYASSALGQTAQANVRHGEVTSAEVVRLDGDGSVAAGATMGGIIGLTYGRASNHSRAVTRRRAALGAVAGGALARRAGGGAQEAMQYEIRMQDGETVRFVTDQDDKRVGDCVVLETVDGMNNIRRVSDFLCLEQSQVVVQEVQPDLAAEADKCAEAKRQLLEAESDEAMDRAITRISILCDD